MALPDKRCHARQVRAWKIRILTPLAVASALAVIPVTTILCSSPPTSPAAGLRDLTRPASSRSASAAWSITSTSPRPFRLMVTGDSIAFHLMPGFQALQGVFDYAVSDETAQGCALERGITGRRLDDGSTIPFGVFDCSTRWRDAVIRDHPDVVVVSLAAQLIGDWRISGRWVHPCDAAYDAWFGRQVAEDLALLTAGGARVVLAVPAPSSGFTGAPRQPYFSRRTECIRADELRAGRGLRDVYTVDFKNLVCPRGHCVDQIDGITLRADGMHYMGPAAELVVRWLGPRLQTLAAFQPIR